MNTVKSIFASTVGAMVLISVFLIICPDRFDKKLISMLAVCFIIISIACGGDFTADFRREYDSIITDAQRYAENIRADAEKYGESEFHEMSEKTE